MNNPHDPTRRLMAALAGWLTTAGQLATPEGRAAMAAAMAQPDADVVLMAQLKLGAASLHVATPRGSVEIARADLPALTLATDAPPSGLN